MLLMPNSKGVHMNKIGVIVTGVIVGAVLLVLLIIALGGSGEAPSSDVSTSDMNNVANEQAANTDEGSEAGNDVQDSAEVAIADFRYTPDDITIRAGTTITWSNQDNVTHTVTPDKGYETDEFQSSGAMLPGSSFSVTFTEPGTYLYFCEPHPSMKGRITVID